MKAARRLFVERGYAATRLEDVAASPGAWGQHVGYRTDTDGITATFSFSPSGAVFGDSLVLVHGTVVTLDGGRRVIPDGAVAIDGAEIVAVDTAEAIARTQLDGVCEQAAKGDLDYQSFLARALETEWRGRQQRGVCRGRAHPPRRKSVAGPDATHRTRFLP